MPQTVPNRPTKGAVAPMRGQHPRAADHAAAAGRLDALEPRGDALLHAVRRSSASADSRSSCVGGCAQAPPPRRRSRAAARAPRPACAPRRARASARPQPAARGRKLERLGEPHRPGHQRGEDQPDHHRLHHDVGVEEHAPGRQIARQLERDVGRLRERRGGRERQQRDGEAGRDAGRWGHARAWLMHGCRLIPPSAGPRSPSYRFDPPGFGGPRLGSASPASCTKQRPREIPGAIASNPALDYLFLRPFSCRSCSFPSRTCRDRCIVRYCGRSAGTWPGRLASVFFASNNPSRVELAG